MSPRRTCGWRSRNTERSFNACWQCDHHVSSGDRLTAAGFFIDGAGQSEGGDGGEVSEARVFPDFVGAVKIAPNRHAFGELGPVVHIDAFGTQAVGDPLKSA